MLLPEVSTNYGMQLQPGLALFKVSTNYGMQLQPGLALFICELTHLN